MYVLGSKKIIKIYDFLLFSQLRVSTMYEAKIRGGTVYEYEQNRNFEALVVSQLTSLTLIVKYLKIKEPIQVELDK